MEINALILTCDPSNCRVWSRLGHGVTTPLRLEAITVCSSPAAVDAISFCYWDEQGKKHNVGPWGGNGGDPYVVSAYMQMNCNSCS